MKKILKILGIIVIVLVVIFIGLDIYGRQGYDPQGNDEVNFDINNLKAGTNKVEYLSHGSKISALLYLPSDFSLDKKLPIIVVTPPNTGVKEQTASLYAQKLTEKGFASLAFDPRGFGESGGHHVLFDLNRQIEDVQSSIDFVSSLSFVDTNNIFNMGVCVGVPISAYETSLDDRIKAQIMVSPVYLSEEDNILPVPMDVAYAVSGFSKLYFHITGNDIPLGPLVQDNPDNDNEVETSLGAGMDDYYLEGKPGFAKTRENHFSMISMANVMEWFDFFKAAEGLNNTPVFIAYGSEAFSKKGALEFYDKLKGEKEKIELKGSGHFDLYWMPEYVNPTVERINKFINKNLK